MSKIFDALRKAEMNKGRVRPAQADPKPRKTTSTAETAFLKGMDEDFRLSLLNLRNSIDSAMKGVDSRIVMFTSSVRGEGKTTIVAYLARVLAMGESDKVLLIDCAVNNPQIHFLFGLKNEKGILEYLSGKVELPDIINSVDRGVLDVVTTGSLKGHDVTQPLFNSERMRFLISQAGERYDYVLIDTSAILEAPETQVLASHSTGVVIVVQAGKTRREVVKRAMMMIEKFGGRFIGSVLNKKQYHIPGFIYRRV